MNQLRKADAEPMVPVTQESMKVLTERPLLAVPPELRPAVLAAWMTYRHLPGLDTPAAIAFPVSLWVGTHGYPAEKVKEALQKVTGPAVMRSVKFASDLTTALAELVHPTPSHRQSTIEKLMAIEAEKERWRSKVSADSIPG